MTHILSRYLRTLFNLLHLRGRFDHLPLNSDGSFNCIISVDWQSLLSDFKDILLQIL